jgi:transmembrane sensor
MSWNPYFFNRLSEDASKEIYFNYYLKIYIYVQWLIQDPHHATIITLHTFLQVCRKGNLHNEHALLASIRRIATDKCLDYIKKNQTLRIYRKEYMANNAHSADLLKTIFDNALLLENAFRKWKQLSPAEQEEKKLEYPPQLKSFVRHYSWPYVPNTYLEKNITNTGEKELNRQAALCKDKQAQSEHFATVEVMESKLRDELTKIDPAGQWECFKKQLDAARQRKMVLFRTMAALVTVLTTVVLYMFSLREFSITSRKPPFSIQKSAIGTGPELILGNASIIKLDSVPDGAIIAPGIPFMKKNSTLVYVHMGPHDQVQDQGINILSVPPCRQYEVTLADSSVIKLNASSQLYFPVNFSKNERWVTMKGEAYFEVKANAERPFLVNLKDQVIVKVTGTSFNINAYNENDYIRTTLIKGRLEITANSSKKSKLLLPRQQAIFIKGSFVVNDRLNVNQVTAWKKGVFYFNEKPIREIMEEIGRWYNVKVIYEGVMPDTLFTASLSRLKPLSEIVNNILMSIPIRIKIIGDTLIVSPKH